MLPRRSGVAFLQSSRAGLRFNRGVIIHRQPAMHNRHRSVIAVVTIVAALFAAATAAADSVSPAPRSEETSMQEHVSGRFDVKLIPQQDNDDPSGIARLLLDKTFHGALAATSRGQMLAIRAANGTSGGYVAMEKVSGTLQGRTGSFHLQHYGLAVRGVNTLTLQVVPDSGTEQLEGLSGTMKIVIKEGGEHFYEFDFALGAVD
jgi:hypothetical protein